MATGDRPHHLQELPTSIATERLLFRPYQPGDSAMYFQMLRANRDHLRDFLPPKIAAAQSEDDVEVFIRWLMEGWQARDLFVFGVWEKETGIFVGESYLANADWQVPCIELGYFVVEESTGKGVATEAARAMLRVAFEHLGVSRVELQCSADNEASRRVAERCGFQYEGRLRQRNRKKDGTLVDRLWFGLLRSEWQASGTGTVDSPAP